MGQLTGVVRTETGGQNNTGTYTLTWVVPSDDTIDKYQYQCENHAHMRGTINVTGCAPAPSNGGGDLNLDSVVDIADVIWLLKHVNGEVGYDFQNSSGNSLLQEALSSYVSSQNKLVNSVSSTHTISGTGTLTSSIVSSLIGDGSTASNVIIQGFEIIDTSAFEGSLLQGTVTIPNTVTSIGNRAFMNCSNITNFIFEENSLLEILGESVFINGQFASFTLPASVKTISRNVFQGCDKLTTFNIMAGSVLSTIDRLAFYGSRISSIDFPASLTTIGESVFESCGSLNTVTFVSGSGSKLNTIGERAFRACTNLEGITLPSSMSTISERAFYECASMTSLSFNSDSVNSNEPLPIMTIGKEAFGNSELTGSITFPATLRSIGMNAFLSCADITSVSFESGSHLWDIGYNAFQGCGLTGNFTIPSSVRIVRTYAFQSCTSLNSVTFESNSQLSGIGSGIFNSCTAFHTVTAPQSVLDLLGIYAGATNNSIGNKTGITAILEGESITIDYNYTFDGFGELTREIVDDAFSDSFSGVSSDVSVSVLVTGYSKLGYRSFYYKGNVISDITLGTSVEIIAERSFEQVLPLKSVNFQGTSTLAKIERYAFFNIENLTSITLPSSLTQLAERAFYYCSGLRIVTFEYPSSLATLGEKTFFVTSLETFSAPQNVLDLYGVTEGTGKTVGGKDGVTVTAVIPETCSTSPVTITVSSEFVDGASTYKYTTSDTNGNGGLYGCITASRGSTLVIYAVGEYADLVSHPIKITGYNDLGQQMGQLTGVVRTETGGQNNTGTYTLTWVVPSDETIDKYQYQCENHAHMRGTINVTGSAPAPSNGVGDLNGDGNVDVSDLVYFQKHLNRVAGFELSGTDFSPP